MKRLFLAGLMALLPAAPALASSVSVFGGSDGVGAVPVAKGTSLIDMRLNAVFPGNAVTAPTLNVVTGIADGVELGIGSGLSFSALGDPSGRTSLETVYPWVRTQLPMGGDWLKTAVVAGVTVPGVQSLSEVVPGFLAVADFATGPVTSSVNLGYARGVTSSTDWTTANVNFTLPMGGVTGYEEQFMNYPLGGYANGGVRASLILPLVEKMTLDLNAAALWTSGAAGSTWTFSPNLGVSYAF